jgi:hypothetical protein
MAINWTKCLNSISSRVVAGDQGRQAGVLRSLDPVFDHFGDVLFDATIGMPQGPLQIDTAVRLIVVAVLLLVPSLAAHEARFGLWSAPELVKRNAALSKKVGPDHSSRETLADHGHHRFRLLYRDADGAPEQHDEIVNVVFVQSGEATLQLGGERAFRLKPDHQLTIVNLQL